MEEPELPDRQILESLLESLEEQDRREQRDRRDVRRRLPTRQWW
jgi:hypothetical protein